MSTLLFNTCFEKVDIISEHIIIASSRRGIVLLFSFKNLAYFRSWLTFNTDREINANDLLSAEGQFIFYFSLRSQNIPKEEIIYSPSVSFCFGFTKILQYWQFQFLVWSYKLHAWGMLSIKNSNRWDLINYIYINRTVFEKKTKSVTQANNFLKSLQGKGSIYQGKQLFCSLILLLHVHKPPHIADAMWKVLPYTPHKIKWNYLNFTEAQAGNGHLTRFNWNDSWVMA